MDFLKFSFGNSKINKLAEYLGLSKKHVVSLDIPAGYTCPMANICHAFANRITGKVTDGKNMQFRCYAVSSECAFTATRKLRWHNYDLLRVSSNMADLIASSIPVGVSVIRVHSSGDFFSKEYFDAWVQVAGMRSDITFFGYTKVLPYVKADKSDNFRLVYSHGGKMDALVTDEPVAYVVPFAEDAEKRGLPVSCSHNPADDYDYVMAGLSFALVMHGTQPKAVTARRKLAQAEA